jgi:peptidylprolyl isomerase
MNRFLKHSIFLFTCLSLLSCKINNVNDNTIIVIKTTLGDIKIKLYDQTPLHRDNFLKLINSGFYNGLSFHRVIKDFMIQTGDPATRSGFSYVPADTLNNYTIPAEFNKHYFHKKGALAAARQGNDINPEMRSSGTQFYIVSGVKFSDEKLLQAEQQINNNIKQAVFNKLLNEVKDSIRLSGVIKQDAEIQELAFIKLYDYLNKTGEYQIPEDQRLVYKNIGGIPRLDGTYTVFGEVIEGLDIVDKISSAQTDSYDKPINDIKIIISKKITN